ncbi:type II toxin-antitoxin system RelE/ParE family toxin [Acuticoccus sediminis]|uniref:type II toxin-antitoxin system RelE/ParE family toxin n=1 Tax=Acuticoccus sediminis TaxID=2184697 RepID=UPI001CFE8000|nr:type II toxin-antitoxin system RelE/ParE family toxin [Acuticoccus sediminis]
MLPIVRTARADEDLIEIWVTVGADDPNAADRLIDQLEARWQQLRGQPYSGLAREDIAPGVRHLVARSYLIFYRVEADAIRIIRVLHGRRQIDRDMVS